MASDSLESSTADAPRSYAPSPTPAISGSATGVTDDERARGEDGIPPALVELCEVSVVSSDLRPALCRVTQLACAAISTVDAASVLVGDPAGPDTVATSNSLAQVGDGIQHRAAAGPSFDAYRLNQSYVAADLAGDARLTPSEPDSAARTDRPVHQPTQPPVRSCRAFPLVADGHPAGVLTLYACRPAALDAAAIADLASAFVVTAQALIRDARTIDQMVTERDQLQQALQYRAVIEQAKGMIMLARRCDADQAFSLLVRMGNASNTKLRLVAERVVARRGHVEQLRAARKGTREPFSRVTY